MSFHLECRSDTLNDVPYCPHFYLRPILQHLFITTNLINSKAHLRTIRKKTIFHLESHYETLNDAPYCLRFYLHGILHRPLNPNKEAMFIKKEAQTFNYPESLSVLINHFPFALIGINTHQCLVVLFVAFRYLLIPFSAFRCFSVPSTKPSAITFVS